MSNSNLLIKNIVHRRVNKEIQWQDIELLEEEKKSYQKVILLFSITQKHQWYNLAKKRTQ